MFEGLIEFIESSIFGLINQISEQQDDGLLQVQAIAQMLLNFAERNPGMTQVLTGDALVNNEDERLQFTHESTGRTDRNGVPAVFPSGRQSGQRD
jgi:TetR/AcrR family transcriptional regulator